MPPAHQIRPPAARKRTRISRVESDATPTLCPNFAPGPPRWELAPGRVSGQPENSAAPGGTFVGDVWGTEGEPRSASRVRGCAATHVYRSISTVWTARSRLFAVLDLEGDARDGGRLCPCRAGRTGSRWPSSTSAASPGTAAPAGARRDGSEVTFPLTTESGSFGALRLAAGGGLRDGGTSDLERLVRHASLAIANARRFERERHVALTFQNAALVSDLPTGSGYRFDAIYEAGRAEALVGGDWYDAFRLADGRFVVSIGDVVGSGLQAAIAMVNVRQTMRGVAQVHPDPALMLEAAERTLRAQHPDRYVTAFVGVLDPVTQQCAYANAGHPGPYLRLPDGALVQIPGGGVPLGLGFSSSIEVRQFVLPPGSVLVLYTDGLIEATRDMLEGERRLELVLRDPALPQRDRVAQYLHDAVLGGARARRRRDPGRQRRDLGARPALAFRSRVGRRRATRVRASCARRSSAPGSDGARCSTPSSIFAELMGNALRYAPGTVELILEAHAERFALHLLDKGPGFQFSPRLPSDLVQPVRARPVPDRVLATEFSVERRPGGGSHARITFDTRPEESTP